MAHLADTALLNGLQKNRPKFKVLKAVAYVAICGQLNPITGPRPVHWCNDVHRIKLTAISDLLYMEDI